MSLTFVNVSRNLSFVELAKVIEQQEELLGTLRIVGPSADSTVLGFEFEVEPPPRPPRVQFAQEGTPEDAEILARGEAYVLGRLVDVLVYRPKEIPQRIAP